MKLVFERGWWIIALLLVVLFGRSGDVYHRFSYLLAGSIDVPVDSEVQWSTASGQSRASAVIGSGAEARLVIVHNGGTADDAITLERDNDFGISRVLVGRDGSAVTPGKEGDAGKLDSREVRFEAIGVPPFSRVYMILLADSPTRTVTRTSATLLRTGSSQLPAARIISLGECIVYAMLCVLTSITIASWVTWNVAAFRYRPRESDGKPQST
jgi:hypothetical protein